jgi:putative hydrolase of the HAD superfamily
LCVDFGIKPDEELVSNLSKMFEESIDSIDLFPHTINMLKSLRDQGFKIGLISNTSESVVDEIRKETQLFNYIDYPCFSFDCGVIKPNPKIFNQMLIETKSKPDEVLMIGDSLIDDIEPAKRIGMIAIHFKEYNQLKKELAVLNISI